MSEKTNYHTVIQEEDKRLKERREKLIGKEFAESLDDNRFGIALSGGGIRSATINLGILKTLHKFGVLKQSDYLSTVSGGGYTGAYIQATLKAEDETNKLFDEEHIEYMRNRGEYLTPGKGLVKLWNQFTIAIAFLVSFLMSLVSPAIIIALIGGGYFFYDSLKEGKETATASSLDLDGLMVYMLYGAVLTFILHYTFNVAKVFKLDGSNWFNRLEAVFVIPAILIVIYSTFVSHETLRTPSLPETINFVTISFILLLLGIFTNPNATSFHRFYRKQLADAFLNFAGQNKNIHIKNLFDTSSNKENDYFAPYPLINTCLNLQASNDENFQGAKASDYFLLSPMYCGSKLVGYVPTAKSRGYQLMTLPAAATISAAAVNPGMGDYSSKLLSILLTIFNLRLGFWVWNPLRIKKHSGLIWWPFYFFYELLGKIGTDKRMVNISDGGHIENLGVMELLRRKCKLIIAVDAGADPLYTFSDLENLTVRARNELGIDIRFRPDQIPENVIRVNPSNGYSKQRYAIADLFLLWEKVIENGEKTIKHYPGGKKVGVFVYVKSAVTAPVGRPNISREEDPLKYATYKYKIYNPDFPHESTADQFFDPIQWESYFQLGQFIGSDILGCDNLNEFDVDQAFTIPLNELYRHFDEGIQLFGSVSLPLPSNRRKNRGLEEAIMEATLEENLGVVTDYEM